MSDDPIFALATPWAESPVAVIRVSGNACIGKLEVLIPEIQTFKPRTLNLTKIKSLEGEVLDQSLVAIFTAPASYTGEDMVEIFPHGNPLIITKIFENFRKIGMRDAQPGEFSKRAFLNGKIDLTQAEALSFYITAKSEAGLKLARQGYFGSLSSAISHLKDRLIEVLAFTEAHIDFTEEDIGNFDYDYVTAAVETVKDEITRMIKNYKIAKIALSGLRVCLVGLPNAGKSSILNLLVGKERAIVSEIPGTTRDYLEDRLTIDGFQVLLYDMAGFRETGDPIEKKGLELARKLLSECDLVLLVHDITLPLEASLRLAADIKREVPVWLILNKMDLNPNFTLPNNGAENGLFEKVLYICALEEKSRNVLIGAMREKLIQKQDVDISSSVINERQSHILSEVIVFLDRFIDVIHKEPLDVACDLLRNALWKIDELTGRTYPDDILSKIFQRFCIGK